MTKSKVELQNIQPYILLAIGALFVLLDKGGFSGGIRSSLSYVFEPVSFVADDTGDTVSEWGYALVDASSYISELNSLKEELVIAKSSESSILLLQEENATLKEQLSLSNREDTFIAAKVLDYSPEGTIRINVGEADGIKEGDVVQLGKVFVGVVEQADGLGSLVRIPINKSSHYEIAILPQNTQVDEELPINSLVKATGVASGSVSGIKLENIGINAEVSDGDIVVLRDGRIGGILVLGRVVGLINNPASTSKSGFVSPVFDYANLITVYVKTN